MSFSDVQPSAWDSDLGTVGEVLFGLMIRNVASAGLVFTDPHAPENRSRPGCTIASPSYWTDLADTAKQDYVYCWKRDGAIAAMEIAAPGVPMDPGQVKTHLTDYVNFAKVCQDAAPGDQAKFTVDGRPFEGWPLQSDGPALQTLALMRVFPLVDAPTQAMARAIVDGNTSFLLGAFQNETTSLWEEVEGNSFFARAVQLQCFTELKTQTLGMNAPTQLDAAVDWLTARLTEHWDGHQYLTFNPAAHKASPGDYDPNIDIVSASIYGAIECTDPKLLATAAKIRRQWTEDPLLSYPINTADHDLSLGPLGPLLGRYPGDYYDGVSDSTGQGHPWALCTCNFAQLYYELAKAIEGGTAIPTDPSAEPFLSDVQVTTTTPPAKAVAMLRAAGDQMLRALIYHSDNLELSEQFDRDSGFERSVSNLTWSYAAFLSALRAR